MALLGKIRNNMWLVVILLALALAGFIFMDMTSAKSGGGFGSQTTLGEVKGEEIDFIEFQRAEEALYSGSGEVYGRRESLWNYFVEKAIVDDITSSNGIAVGADELNELEFGNNLSPIMQSYFRNPQTGQVDRNQLNEVKTAIENGTVTNPEFANRFNELRKQVIKTQKQTKLSNLVAKAIYTPTWYAETMDKLNNETAEFDYVSIPFDSIADSSIKLTDEDFAAYIKEHESRFTNKEEVRNLDYLTFDVRASKQDSAAIAQRLTNMVEAFKNAENDSLYAATKKGFMMNTYAKMSDLTGPLKEEVGQIGVGEVYGPYIDNGIYTLAKLVSKKIEADSAKASHILRTVENGDPIQLAAAQKYIDSLKKEIQSKKISFADAATANSQDPGSAAKGGELGTFAPGMMVPQFNNAVFGGKEGELYTVTTQFGVHLIFVEKLIYKTNEMKYQFAYVGEPIIPSDSTINSIEDKVFASLDATKTIDDMKKLVNDNTQMEFAGGLKINDYTFGNLAASEVTRDMVKWAFDEDTEVGQVSPHLYTINDPNFYVPSKYIIIGLASIDKPGIASVSSVKAQITDEVMKKKKAEYIKSQISGTDLNAIASKYGVEVEHANNVTFGSAMLTQGQEHMFVAKIFAASNGAFVGPVEGQYGVYVAKLNTKNPANTESGSFSQKLQLTQGRRLQVSYNFIESLKKAADVKDQRAKFF
ncbi:MAG: peptidylprolyl isomerase [Saprospiraceae bacterium]|nr:peptidylprolyl isomerase [Saprospiraceae bacterium]MCZ2337761.1 peptidylprolyl isomerase [Chitinophagales bacterium]